MKNEDKEILKHLVKKELKCLKEDEEKIKFPSIKLLTSMEVYEDKLKKLLKTLS